jgi:hypothetical protein
MATKRPWTVLAYIVADHKALLPEDVPPRIDQIAHMEVDNLLWAADLSSAHVAVQVDYTFEPGILRVIADGDGTEKTVLPEAGSSRTETFKNFIREVAIACPADRYMLLVWGHGFGPVGYFVDANGNDIAATGDLTLNLPELADVLSFAAGASGFKQPIDLLLVKSCSVATVEGAWEVEPYVKYLVGSQATVPLREWSYGRIFKALEPADYRSSSETPLLPLEDQAIAVLNAVDHHYQFAVAREGQAEVPYSLLRPSRVKNLKAPMRELVAALSTQELTSAALRESIAKARHVPTVDPAVLDLRSLCESLQGVPSVSKAAAELLKWLEMSGESPVVTRRPAASAFGGIGIFYMPPIGSRLPSFGNWVTTFDYRALKSSVETSWDKVAFAEDKVTFAEDRVVV